MKLAINLRDLTLLQNIKKQMKLNLPSKENDLVDSLILHSLGEASVELPLSSEWKIDSINELRKIKQILAPISSTHKLLSDHPRLAALRQALLEPDESQRKDLEVMFSDFQL